MIKRLGLLMFTLIAGLPLLATTSGCGAPSNEAIAPDEFAPPPTEADEKGEDSGG